MMWEGKEIMEDYGNNTSFFLKTPIILVFYLMVLTLLYIIIGSCLLFMKPCRCILVITRPISIRHHFLGCLRTLRNRNGLFQNSLHGELFSGTNFTML